MKTQFALTLLGRRVRSVSFRFRQTRTIVRALKSRRHPILAHIIPVRRCNLSCAYCNEYDDFSKPVSTSEMLRRVDLLAALGTGMITISGGEPLLHPELEQIVQHIRGHGIIATLITNGYLLTADRIGRLNDARLDHLQISIDNVLPDDASMKSLKVLDKKLELLARHARFEVNINSVVGSSIRNPEDAPAVARRARELRFTTTVGVIHDHAGQLKPLDRRHRAAYDETAKLGKDSFASFAYYKQFQENLIRGLPNEWHCRAGSRYLYICEDGLVHYCSQQRGYPAIPLDRYTANDLEREYHTRKPCAPYCTISCVHQVAMIDHLREKPMEALERFFPPGGAKTKMPGAVKILKWMFLSNGGQYKPGGVQRLFSKMALRIFGAK